VIDYFLHCVDDPDLQRVIDQHRQDELRHERMFRERLAAQGALRRGGEALRARRGKARGAAAHAQRRSARIPGQPDGQT
jgi:hypothetical protein